MGIPVLDLVIPDGYPQSNPVFQEKTRQVLEERTEDLRRVDEFLREMAKELRCRIKA